MFTRLSRRITAWGALVTFGCFPMVLDGDQPGRSADKLEGAVVLGQILSSSGAVLNGVAALGDTTLIAGSTLKTADHGMALVAFSADTRATLGERTSATFQRKGGRLIAEVSSGTIAAQAPGKGILALETPKFAIEPAGDGLAVYALAMLPNNNTEVDARRGPVLITEKASGDTYVLKEGYYAEVGGPDQSSPPQQPKTGPGGPPPGLASSPGKLFIIAVAAGVGVAVILDKTVLSPPAASPSAP